jgi:hypothetical protein
MGVAPFICYQEILMVARAILMEVTHRLILQLHLIRQ